jgi:hypothetical protein
MLTTAGVEALLKVKEQKLADPDSLVMHTYLDHFGATCIGGQLILNKYGMQRLKEAEQIDFECHKLAGSIVGIPFEGDPDNQRITDSLFHRLYWDKDLYNRWQNSTTANERAQIVAEVINRFIAKNYQEEG